MLQADFIVPSSREAVDCDSAWNELLREQVPNLFLQALHSFKELTPTHADLPMAWLNRWLQSIPLPREVHPDIPSPPRPPPTLTPMHTSPVGAQLTMHNSHLMGLTDRLDMLLLFLHYNRHHRQLHQDADACRSYSPVLTRHYTCC